RIAGEPVAMSPERVIHARLKARVWRALDRELRTAGLPCEALPDGITVEVGDDTDYEPDAVVNCGEALPDDAVAATNPVIVVEVLSPSTSADDPRVKCPRASFAGKLADYTNGRKSRLSRRRQNPELSKACLLREESGLWAVGITSGCPASGTT